MKPITARTRRRREEEPLHVTEQKSPTSSERDKQEDVGEAKLQREGEEGG
jgi:hypothetical protein